MNTIQQKTTIIIIDSALLACGILGIIIPNIINSNWYSLLTILLFIFSIIFPLMCNALEIRGSGYSSTDIMFMDDSTSAMDKGKALSWFLTGLTITVGYSIPFLLWRNKEMFVLNMGMAMGGGTVILISIIVFVKFVLY